MPEGETSVEDTDEGSGVRGFLIGLVGLVIVVVAVWVGILVGRILGAAPWVNATLLVSGLLFFAWAAILFAILIPSMLHFVRCGRVGDLPVSPAPPTVILVLALVALAAFGSRATGAVGKPSLAILSTWIEAPSNAPSNTKPEPPAPVSPARDYFMVPFYADEGQSRNCSDQDPAFGNAQKVHPGSAPVIDFLVQGLKACVEGDKHPEIDVRGFASSSGFRNCPIKDSGDGRATSDQLNLLLAEKRRSAVLAEIKRVDPSGQIHIFHGDDARRWSTIEEMRANVRVVDWDSSNTYSTTRGILSRRAEIVITDKGACEKTTATSLPPPVPAPE